MATATAPVRPRPCIACGVMVLDLIHVGTGRPAPIEAEPVVGGNIGVDLEAGTYRLLGRVLGDETPRYLNHFATCPQRERFRGDRRG